MSIQEMIREVLQTEYRPVSARWIEVRVWADFFDSKTIYGAPDTFDIRRALAEMEKLWTVKVTHPGHLFQLANEV